jgi:hypothetical protein
VILIRMRRAALLAVVGACGGEPSDPPAPCSLDGVTGAVPGITLSIHASSCTYKAGSAVTFTYDIDVDASVPTLHYPAETTTCTARPHPYTADPTSLVTSTVANAEQSYCWDCDFECAPGEGAVTLQLTPGRTSGVLVWSGHAGSPMVHGDVFEPGDFGIRVAFDGGDVGTMAATLGLTLEP